MQLYNSLTNQKEELKTIRPNEVSMYLCGPTVYNYPHVGNTRNMIVFDVLRRTLEFQGIKVQQMVNFTDVDDKIINRAKEEGVSESEVSEKYIAAYNQIRHDLHVLMPTYTPRVTETMDDIIKFIAKLVENKAAYVVDGDVYFDVESDKYYGELSKNTIEDLKVGARVDADERKKSPLDFALWKHMEEGLRWESPWGEGRPGWHTECVVMINKQFENGSIDIHMGGNDLKFPHHENEIAQSRMVNGHPIAHTWIHNAMLNIGGAKMSKSLANGLLANEMIATHGGNAIRWMMLNTHYRLALNYSDEVLETAKSELVKINTPIRQLDLKVQINDVDANATYNADRMVPFIEALNDDLNISNAITVVYEVVKELNQLIRTKDIDYSKALEVEATLLKMLDILGIEFDRINLSAEDKETYKKWNEAKANKNFDEADKYREILSAKGIL